MLNVVFPNFVVILLIPFIFYKNTAAEMREILRVF